MLTSTSFHSFISLLFFGSNYTNRESINALAAHGNYVCTGDDAGVVKVPHIGRVGREIEVVKQTHFNIHSFGIQGRPRVYLNLQN
jgi:hypothetical protein